MTHATETDLSLLTWVKGEIEAALGRAAEALREIRTGSDAASQAQFSQTHLHQVRGALAIISLDGLAQFTGMAEALLAQMGRGELAIDSRTLALAKRSFASISNYLEEIAHGAADQPLRLFPLYAELAQARGLPAPEAGELFHPDLSRRPPAREEAAPALKPAMREQALRHARTHYSQGLLHLLRKDSSRGVRMMREAAGMIESIHDKPAHRVLWWVAQAFFDRIPDNATVDTAAYKRLCTRIEAYLRQLMVQPVPPALPERLLRDLLYQVAIAPAETPRQRLVREHWGLDQLLPPEGSTVSDVPLEPLLRSLQQALDAVHRQWDEFTAGTAIALVRFDELLNTLITAARPLGRPASDALLASLKAFVRWLRDEPLRFNDGLALEVATALLLLESDFGRRIADPGLSAQMRHRAKRIVALIRGEAPPPDSDLRHQDAARASEEQQALIQLCSEMRLSLAQVEQTLDDFFRNQEKHEALAQLEQPLQQLIGMLSVLGETSAVALVAEARRDIEVFAENPTAGDSSAFENLAHQLSALGFFLEALPYGKTSLEHFLNPLQAPAPASDTTTELPAAAAHAEEAAAPDTETSDSDDSGRAAENSVEAGLTDAEDEFDEQFITQLEPLADATIEPAPTLAPPAPLPESEAAIDAELLEIFIEEAVEVLATIDTHLGLLGSEPEEEEHLITVRRGFHTLKGSGRMVGLSELGETAWGMEQTLNRWLQLDWPPLPPLLALVRSAHTLFSQWVSALQQGQTPALNTGPLLAEAERLRTIESADAASLRFVAPAAGRPALSSAEPPSASAGAALPDAEPLPDTPVAPAAPQAAPQAAESAPEASESVEIIEAAPLEIDFSFDEAPASSAPTPSAPTPSAPDTGPLAETAASAPAAELASMADTDTGTAPAEELAPATPPTADAAQAAPQAEPQPPATEFAPPAAAAPPPEPDSIFIGELELSRKLLSIYQSEALSHLDILGQELELLATQAGRKPAEAAVRAAHTLAGTSATARLSAPHELSRALELALIRLRERGQGLNTPELELLRETVNTLQTMQVEISALQLPSSAPALLAALEDCPGAATAFQASPATSPVTSLANDDVSTPAATVLPPSTTPLAAAPHSTADSPPPVDEIDAQLLPIFLEEAAEQLNELYATLRNWHAESDAVQHPQAAARLLHSLKGSARMAGAMSVGSHFHLLESRLIEAQRDGTAVPALVDELNTGLDQIEQLIDGLAGVVSADEAPAEHAGDRPTIASSASPTLTAGDSDSAGGSLRVRAELVDRFVNQAGEIGIARTRVEGELRGLRRALLDLTENVIRLRQQLREVEIQSEVQMQSRIAQTEAEEAGFDPLEMDRYTRLQELTRMMAESVNDVTTVQQVLLHNLDSAESALNTQGRMNRELQQSLMNVRMLPFDSLAERLYRVVRQSARDEGKRASLDIHDGDIELDRSILEQMAAPLEHLLRNALAHGIETPEQRKQAGKAESGQLSLSVRQEGNEVAIELSDDGRGLDLERIASRARDSGLIDADAQPDPRQLANLIFHPGFSTATQVSSIAGRGVGMDVVRSQTAALGGRIEIDSRAGAGTRILIHLPLTLAITQALLVEADGRRWALPANMIAQAQELKTEPMNEVRSKQGTEWEGEFYPYRYLPELLGHAGSTPQEQRYHWLLLLRAGAQRLALHVDSLAGNQEIVVKNAGPQLTRTIGFSGATVLADGEIALILNPIALAERSPAPETATDQAPAALAEQLPVQSCVMVVDDSLTVRRITGRLLEREGYRVMTAKDGVDALEQLGSELPDVVLSDIEMPRMDGFDLLRNIRAGESTRHLPVIMITSRLADKHRNHAFELGANHYLGKPYQEEELLALISSLISSHLASHLPATRADSSS
ncbi:MAG: Hpt domain-containing protein [Thauera sp.]|jgi:chemosensory pili system protein ChpA (sensor histidine kinase/response regulator)|nr:Hpt domain-containing protein [Thauera sp.]